MTPDRHPPVEIVDISSNPIPQRINLARIAQLKHKFDDRYDSNDGIGPFNDAVELEGEQYFEENMLSESPPVEVATFSDWQLKGEEQHDLPYLPPQQLPDLPLSLQVLIPIQADELVNISKLALLHYLEILDVLFKSYMKHFQ